MANIELKKTVHVVLSQWLRDNGYDGLTSGHCGCQAGDLAPCGEDCMACQPAYLTETPEGEDGPWLSTAAPHTKDDRRTDNDVMDEVDQTAAEGYARDDVKIPRILPPPITDAEWVAISSVCSALHDLLGSDPLTRISFERERIDQVVSPEEMDDNPTWYFDQVIDGEARPIVYIERRGENPGIVQTLETLQTFFIQNVCGYRYAAYVKAKRQLQDLVSEKGTK